MATFKPYAKPGYDCSKYRDLYPFPAHGLSRLKRAKPEPKPRKPPRPKRLVVPSPETAGQILALKGAGLSIPKICKSLQVTRYQVECALVDGELDCSR